MRPVGDHASLLELPDNASVHAAARLARERYGDRLEEVVPGHLTLLLVWRHGRAVSGLEEELDRASGAQMHATGDPITIPVAYDGADLDGIASRLEVSCEAVVKLHCAVEYTVAFMGFAPGFPYLLTNAPSPLLELPRLATPRTEVPAGSVAVAAGYCGIYPRSAPGGWNLLGRTDVVLFDTVRERPALLEPGARVRFTPR